MKNTKKAPTVHTPWQKYTQCFWMILGNLIHQHFFVRPFLTDKGWSAPADTRYTESRQSFLLHFDCLVNYSGCPKQQIILNGTNRNIIFDNYYYYYHRHNQRCSWKITANEGQQVKLVLERMRFRSHRWCGLSCSCSYLEIQNGTYADGSTTTRMCGYLLGSVIIYSHVGHGLRIQAVILSSWWASFRASYTIITHEDTVSDGRQLQRLWVLARANWRQFLCVCPLIDDKLRHNNVKVAVEITSRRPIINKRTDA